MILLSPSIVRLERPIEECARILNNLGCQSVHVDVCQGFAFPDFFSLDDVQSGSLHVFNGHVTMHLFRSQLEDCQIDLSFLRENDLAVLHVFSDTNVDSVSEFFEAVQLAGCRPGISLDIKMDFSAIEPYLSSLDTVFVMGIPVATYGLQLEQSTLVRLDSMSWLIAKCNLHCRLGLDGGVNTTTFRQLITLVDGLVVGGLLFYTDDIVAQWAALTAMAKGGRGG